MIERTQPVCVGVDKNGELMWKIVPMPRWQMEMFRIPYVGDFMAFWMKRMLWDKTGWECLEDEGSLTLESGHSRRRRKPWRHPGD